MVERDGVETNDNGREDQKKVTKKPSLWCLRKSVELCEPVY